MQSNEINYYSFIYFFLKLANNVRVYRTSYVFFKSMPVSGARDKLFAICFMQSKLYDSHRFPCKHFDWSTLNLQQTGVHNSQECMIAIHDVPIEFGETSTCCSLWIAHCVQNDMNYISCWIRESSVLRDKCHRFHFYDGATEDADACILYKMCCTLFIGFDEKS